MESAEWEQEIETEGEREYPPTRWWPIGTRRSCASYWVRHAQVRFNENFAKLLEEWSLIPSEWAVVRELYRPGCRSTVELGQVFGMSKGGMSKLIDRLIEKDYVRKEVSEFDRRFRPIALTEFARERVPFLARMEKSLDREFFGQLKGRGRYRLRKCLKRTLTASQRKHMQEWVLQQSEDYWERSEGERFWNDLRRLVAATVDPRSSGEISQFGWDDLLQ
jgi:DNA-binding MarR family transcriptional regulator